MWNVSLYFPATHLLLSSTPTMKSSNVEEQEVEEEVMYQALDATNQSFFFLLAAEQNLHAPSLNESRRVKRNGRKREECL